MADLAYNNFLEEFMEGTHSLLSAGDMRVALVMTNTTCDTERDKVTLAGFATVDEFDGSGYTNINAGGGALTSEAVTQDDSGSDQGGVWDAADITFSALSNGTRLIQGCVIFKFSATPLTNGIPFLYIDSGFGSGINPGGGDLTVAWNSLGIFRLESPGQ